MSERRAYLLADFADVNDCLMGRARLNTALLPKDATVIHLGSSYEQPGRWAILVASDEFPETPDGDSYPCLGDAQFCAVYR